MSELEEYGNWANVPEHLKTKTGLGKMGLRVAKGQKPAAVKTHWHYSISDYDLYDMNEAVAKRKPTEKQLAALAKARAAALAVRTCDECGYVDSSKLSQRDGQYLCENCWFDRWLASTAEDAAEWAKKMLATEGALILDSETTGLDGEIVELAIIDMLGKELFNHRFRPVTEIESGATAVHGMTNEMLEDERDFCVYYDQLSLILEEAAVVVIYNASFDVARLRQTCRLHKQPDLKFKSDCAMEQYAAFVGDWHDYYESFTWQRLPGGDHTAVGDCRATLAVLQKMARGNDAGT